VSYRSGSETWLQPIACSSDYSQAAYTIVLDRSDRTPRSGERQA
jgi:hypothetical protein